MDIALAVLAFILLLAGIAGAVIPGLPGPPLGYLGVLPLHFSRLGEFSVSFLILWALVAGIITLLDYLVPIYGAKKLGGSKAGVWGSTIGLILGIFLLPPFGIIIFPFIGAILGELIAGKNFDIALKAGTGAFLGFLTGTFLKLAYGVALTVICIIELIQCLPHEC